MSRVEDMIIAMNEVYTDMLEGSSEDFYATMRKLPVPIWNTVMSDIQSALSSEGKIVIPTDVINKALSRVVRR